MAVEKQKVVVIGGGGHAKVLLHVLERLSEFHVLGYVDPRDYGPSLGHRRLGGDDALPLLAQQGGVGAVIGVGKIRGPSERMQMFARLKELGFSLPVVVAPRALVSRGCSLGEGTVIMDGAVVQPGCVIGNACIVNTNAVVEHDCTLGDDVHVAPGAVLSGNVSVGEGSLVGVGACVVQGVRIVGGCTIGAGAAVVEDCLDSGMYLGVPARKVGA